jgi:hypothetical protein
MATRPKRRRNYKAEYARRIARAAAAGKTRQQGRGHKAREHVTRARRTRAKYGVSPAQLGKLRKAAFDRVMALFNATARNPVSERTVHRGMRMLHGDDLQSLIDMDDVDVLSAVKVSDAYLYQLDEYFPHSIDEIESEGHNPLWYHR